jgi:type II secretory pathway pseudopilin PulG
MVDWHIGILLVAIVFTFLAWRRARRENEVAQARAAALEEPRWTYRLQPLDGLDVSGYRVISEDGRWSDDSTPRWDQHGIDIIELGPDNVRAEAVRDDAFEAGAGVHLTTEHDAAGAVRSVWVWDEQRGVHLGWIPAPLTPVIAARLAAGDLSDCVVLRETFNDGERAGVHLLLVHRDTAVEA